MRRTRLESASLRASNACACPTAAAMPRTSGGSTAAATTIAIATRTSTPPPVASPIPMPGKRTAAVTTINSPAKAQAAASTIVAGPGIVDRPQVTEECCAQQTGGGDQRQVEGEQRRHPPGHGRQRRAGKREANRFRQVHEFTVFALVASAPAPR